MPHYEEAGECLHRKGKLVGTHMDGSNALILDLLGQTPFDYIEAYDVSMSPDLTAAANAFEDKAIWINWPSGHHLDSPQQQKALTLSLLGEMQNHKKFLIGITENVPPDRWQALYTAITQAIREFYA